jgi:hypothetical protein
MRHHVSAMCSNPAGADPDRTTSPFTDPDAVARSRNGPPRQVPGFVAARYAAYGVGSGFATDRMEKTSGAIGDRLPVLSPEDDEALLREAGFRDVSLFYAALTFRGWVAYD